MTSPPPAAPHGHRGQPARPAGITRIVQTDDLPDGVDALASADGKTIIVRRSLDQIGRRRAMREVMASIRRFPRLALYPALSLEAARQMARRVANGLASAVQELQQLISAISEHGSSVAVALTAAAGTAAVVTVVVATATPSAGTGSASSGPPAAVSGSQPGGHHKVATKMLPPTPLHYLGVYEQGVPDSYEPVAQFEAATGVQPNIALYYSSWNEKFKSAFAEQAYNAGATPAVQIEPFGVSVADIASGKYDSYLQAFATAVVDYGEPVIIGFAHEPDGDWYPWGAGGPVAPATYIAAWQHVVNVFRKNGADNVIWLWTINAQGPEASAAAQWWPGPNYVTWIGIDGYLTKPSDTFASVFGSMLAITAGLGRPVLISETAVGPGTGHQDRGIANLFAGLRANKLLGLIWFDKAQDSGEFRQDWRLEGNADAIRAFRADAGYLSS